MSNNLELRDVRKAYGDFVAVDGVSLAVPPGAVFGLLGQNGAGKTTSIRMIMDILAPDRGEVLLFGRPRQPEDLRRIGYLPEERGLYRKMTVSDHLLFFAELHSVERRKAQKLITDWLERVELGAWAKAKVEALSKGMQQKVQLVGTILHDPDILILDEPFSGLDPIAQGLFKELIADFKARGKTILFSTHILEQAEKLCDHICLISHGKVVLSGELAAIKRERGGNVYRLATLGDKARVASTPGVAEVVDQPSGLRLVLAPDAQPAAVLRALVERVDVTDFRSEEPDLETLFIQAVRHAN
ncbi:MAG: ATP-binding cassette domain-containing protein [Thermoanaerobaculia bacterium]